jgi:hypothetical protein
MEAYSNCNLKTKLMGDFSYERNFDLDRKNEIQHRT